MNTKFNLVYTWSDGSTGTELCDFNCVRPLEAIKLYAQWVAKDQGCVVDIFPAENTPLATFGNNEAPKTVFRSPPHATLFENKGCCGGACHKTPSDYDSFTTPESTWIDGVAFENGIMTVHYLSPNGDGQASSFIASREDYDSFKEAVANGDSAGSYFNNNIKGVLPKA